jgi:anti-sigma-K factor RskA
MTEASRRFELIASEYALGTSKLYSRAALTEHEGEVRVSLVENARKDARFLEIDEAEAEAALAEVASL